MTDLETGASEPADFLLDLVQPDCSNYLPRHTKNLLALSLDCSQAGRADKNNDKTALLHINASFVHLRN